MTPETRTARLAEIGELACRLHAVRLALSIAERDGAREDARRHRREAGDLEIRQAELIDRFAGRTAEV